MSTEIGHESKDASVRLVVWTMAGLGAGAVIVGLIVYAMFQYLANHPLSSPRVNPMAETEQAQLPPTPRIEDHPAIEVHELHSQEEEILSTYGWTDQSKGIVRIPIDRAMELQLAHGFPTTAKGKR